MLFLSCDLLDPLCRVRELEAKNCDLKLLVSQFAERLSRAELDSLEKSRRVGEKDLGTTTAGKYRKLVLKFSTTTKL